MAAINFPASPAPGDTFTAAGVTWTWDGSKWTGNGLSQQYLPLTGGTLTGPLTLAGNPVGVLDAAPKQYIDAQSLYPHDNRIINGDMRIDQRNNGALGTATGVYTCDRWFYVGSVAGKGTWQRGSAGVGSATAAQGIGFYLTFTSLSAYASAAGDSFQFYQPIEADMVTDFAWGTSGAQPVTLSFWVTSTLTGTFSGSISNSPTTRSYPFTFIIPTASTWTKIAVTIPGDTAGTWAMTGNGAGVIVHFDLGVGSTYRGPAGAWASGNYIGANGAVGVVATNGALYQLSGVKLEIGSVATPFNRQSLAKSMVDCQRYYQTMGAGLVAWGYGIASSVVYGSLTYPPMRAAPTVSYSSLANGNSTGCSVNSNNASILVSQCTVTAAGMGFASAAVSLTAEL